MPELVFAIPGDLDTPTGGYRYDRRMLGEMRALGASVRHLRLPDGFPDAGEAAATEALRQLRDAPPGPVLVDGLAFGVLPAEGLRATGRTFAALVHHPLALETGLDAVTAARFRESERAALARAEGVIVTSRATAATLGTEYAVDPARLVVVEPGADPRPRAAPETPPLVLAVGSLLPRKAHSVLIGALERCADLPWRCVIAGSDALDPAEAARLRTQLAASSVADRVRLAGALSPDALDALYVRASVFALASVYEGYGMVFAEALAHGLPIVATTGGSIPEVVPAEAGLLALPGDVDAFAEALRSLLEDDALRASKSDGAWAAGQRLPRWRDGAAAMLRFLGGLTTSGA